MRVERCFQSLLVLVALGVVGCGGSPLPPAAPTEPVPPAASAAAPTAAEPTSEEDGWAGESAAKSGDTTRASPSEPAATRAGDPKAPELRSMEVIRQLVLDNRKAARKCYEDAHKDLQDLKGDVVIHFVIDPEGNVKSAELNLERSTLKTPAVSDCVIDVIKGIKFPKSSRGMETSANYPFKFTP